MVPDESGVTCRRCALTTEPNSTPPGILPAQRRVTATRVDPCREKSTGSGSIQNARAVVTWAYVEVDADSRISLPLLLHNPAPRPITSALASERGRPRAPRRLICSGVEMRLGDGSR